MRLPDAVTSELERLRRRSLLVGIVAFALLIIGAAASPADFFHAYLTAYLFWIGIALGCLALLMLHHLVAGNWGFVIQRLLESASRTLPLMAVLFVPLLFGLKELYLWARPEAVAVQEILQHRQPYLNVPFFAARLVVYFAIWILLASLLSRWSSEQDQTGAANLTRRLQRLSAPGLVLYALTVSFASFDWVMTLGRQWHSTLFGAVFMVGQGLAALCFVTLMLARLAHREPLAGVASPARFHDLGNLILAFVMLWAYMAFSQYLIIWSGNLPDEIPWYLDRMRGRWEWVAMFLMGLHFVVPFLLLLSRTTKRRASILTAVAVGVLAMRFVDLFYIVTPSFRPAEIAVHWMDIVAPIGIGGIWVWAFAGNLKGRPLLPARDPRFVAVAEHAHGI